MRPERESIPKRQRDCASTGQASPHCLGELHVLHAVLKRRVRDLSAAADRVDEFLFNAPLPRFALRDFDF